MPLPPHYFPVYARHVRLPEPGLHAQPLIQTPPVPHLEGLHYVQWIKSDPKKLTKTVQGDGQALALRNFDSGRFIPHLPLPPSIGPYLWETVQNSKYQVIFHQPNVQMDGGAVGVFQFLIAPPWRCLELRLPLPKFLAKAGRAGAARKAKEKVDKLAKARQKAIEEALEVAETALPNGAGAPEGPAPELKALADARKAELDAMERRELLDAYAAADGRERSALEAEQIARSKQREHDALARRADQAAERHRTEARAQTERAANATGKERASALAAAQHHRAQAEAARSVSVARAEEARSQHRAAKAAQQVRNQAREERAQSLAAAKKDSKHRNLHKEATGAGNATASAPSLFAHVPMPATVHIHVSWSQIGKTWGLALVNLSLDLLNYYVGILFDGLPGPDASKLRVWVLDFAKGVVNDTLIGGAQKFLMEDKLNIKVGLKLGPVTVSTECQRDPKSKKWSWTVSAVETDKHGKDIFGKFGAQAKGSLSDGNIETVGLTMNKESVSVTHLTTDPVVDYGQKIPEVK